MARAYRSANTYRDDARMSMVFERPNKIAYRSRDMQVYCDGVTRSVYRKFFDQYVTRPAPEVLSSDLSGDTSQWEWVEVGMPSLIPLRASLLLDENPWVRLLKDVVLVEMLDDREVDGEPCRVLYLDHKRLGKTLYKATTLYVDRHTHLVKRIVLDTTTMRDPFGGGGKIDSQYVIAAR